MLQWVIQGRYWYFLLQLTSFRNPSTDLLGTVISKSFITSKGHWCSTATESSVALFCINA